ncbi:MAG: hypothetical protein WDN25_27235 [Acetobacteraceae bacterium]
MLPRWQVLRAALDIYVRSGWMICYSEFLGVLAEGVAGRGELPDATAMIQEALEWSNRTGEQYYAAELLRIKGEISLRKADEQSVETAEGCFREALDVASRQGALMWELRAATSLARLRIRQDRRDDARRVLAPVHARFTEGFETADLCAARELLEIL